MDSAPAQHTADYLSEAFGFVVGKKVGPPAGTTAVLAVEGSPVVAVEVDESGRGSAARGRAGQRHRAAGHGPGELHRAGRRPPRGAPGAVTIDGDRDLGEQIVAKLGTTP